LADKKDDEFAGYIGLRGLAEASNRVVSELKCGVFEGGVIGAIGSAVGNFKGDSF
jgi:hypothetical protein